MLQERAGGDANPRLFFALVEVPQKTPEPPMAWQALEEERDGLSHILGRERSHGSGLEQLIEASRLREASVAAEQRQLAKEKDRLEMKV